MNASATGPRARNAFSAAVLGRGARRGWSGPGAAVVLVDDAGLTRGDQRVVGDDLAGERLEHLHPAVGDAITSTLVPISRLGTE